MGNTLQTRGRTTKRVGTDTKDKKAVEKEKYQAPPYQEYNLWVTQYLKYAIFFGYYMLGANVPPEEYTKEIQKKYGVKIHARGRKRDITIETKDSTIGKTKWNSYTLGDLNVVEKERSLLPPELYARMNPAQWGALYEKISNLWEEYANLRRWYLTHNEKLICSLMDKSIKYRTAYGANTREDLRDESYKGAIRAYDKYKYTSGMRIATLMAHHISNVTKELIDRNLSVIQTPSYVQALKRNIYMYEEEFKEKNGRAPTRAEIKEHVGRTKTNIGNVYGIEYNLISSLDAPIGEDGESTLQEILADPNNEIAKKYYDKNEPKNGNEYIKEVFKGIKDPEIRTAALATLNHGATGAEAIRLIAAKNNASKEKARRILSNISRLLRRNIHTCLLQITDNTKPASSSSTAETPK